MSRAAKATLAASVVATTFTVWFVHYQQQQEHEVRPLMLYFIYAVLSSAITLPPISGMWGYIEYEDDVQRRATRRRAKKGEDETETIGVRGIAEEESVVRERAEG